MASFVVMEPPRASGEEPGVQAVFVRDGFSVLAFIAPVLWLLWYRLWLEAILTLAAAVAIMALGTYAGLGQAAPAVSLLVSFYIAIEGQAMRLTRLRRLGWHEADLIEASGRNDAEARYFAQPWVESGSSTTGAPRPVAAPATGRTGPALGLFEYPGN